MARRRAGRVHGSVAALPWIGPAIVLIAAIVLFPAGFMIWTSTRDLSPYGIDRGDAGFENYSNLFAIDGLARILVNTGIWVVAVVAITVVLSMALAQFLNKQFPGRRIIRLAVLVPWAASVVMTSTVVYYMLDPNVGVANRFFTDIGLLDEGYGFTKNPIPAFIVSIVVAVFVSIPFTTYTLLAGLQGIPSEMLDAADVDGASAWQRYRDVILPQLRPALAVAVIINIINVFNSLPILWVLTGSIAGNKADTTTTLTFKLIRTSQQVDTAAAMSVFNFLLIIVIIAVYLKVARPMREQ
ncbi:carbohydrate ABC transporter permease [Solicola gregarius]|uniref:Sugar ABC transporter permease n=1 Tax=Solicola gregarius TaxID=2908642 RepID=A0AA46TF10_9ACTN|nr:sugar ABC transporter permease [Solicola gregarius]UYM04149.1 sugar ABC transporter permease [Solicola gregarius]